MAVEDGQTCHAERSPDSPSLFQNGNLVFQAHHVGWIVASFFTLVAVVTSFWLVNAHLRWYTNKKEQRHIVRLLFMVPIYAVISLASYFFWNNATPLLLIRDAYESIVLTAFFYLLLTYLSPKVQDQQAIFLKVGLSRVNDAERIAQGQEKQKWMFPLGFIKSKPADGLYFLQIMKWGVLQYCAVRPLTTLAAVILNYVGWYCEGSFSPKWGYIYILAVVSASVSIAMYCLIQLYMPVAEYLTPHKPLLKLFAVKAVVFLTFWQASFLAALAMFGVIKDTQYMTSEDINIGIGALLQTFEMMLFGFLHLKAFSYKPYRPFHDPKSNKPPPQQTPRLRALAHAMDFRETFRELKAACVYLLDRIKGREPTPDRGARRLAHYEGAFDRTRPSNLPTSKVATENLDTDLEKGLLPRVQQPSNNVPWLKLPGDDRREKSEDLEVQIGKELERRGYGSHIPGRGHIGQPPESRKIAASHKPQRSWWRSVYSRVSQSAAEADEEENLTSKPMRRKQTRSRHRSRDLEADRRLLVEHDLTFDDPPPPSLFRSHQSRFEGNHRSPVEEHYDRVAPLSAFDVHRSSRQQRPSNKVRKPPPPPALSDSSRATSPSGESLFGRIFPPSINPPSSLGHAPASDAELPSVSAHGVSPARATPRGHLVVSTPQIVSPSKATANYNTPEPQVVTMAIRSVEAIPYPGSQEWSAQGSHRRDSALAAPPPDRTIPNTAGGPPEWTALGSHGRDSAVAAPRPNRPIVNTAGGPPEWTAQGAHARDFADKAPVLTLNTQPDGLITSPLSADVPSEFGRFSGPHRPTNLRRQSAQVSSPASPSRTKRRQSVDTGILPPPPQRPQMTYTRPAERERGRTSNRTTHNQYEEQLRRSGYNVENMRSDITQPSYSGTAQAYKYPTPAMPTTLVMPGSLAQPGLPARQISNPLSYPHYSYADPASSSSTVNRTSRSGSASRGYNDTGNARRTTRS
ncbi:hypothetical protein MKEN_00673000 [Mycena kentingensis (nom. inval.)]|nr:hypothetical protein MKEN_00673000 [Mycena kentingensis (nom. inval.)]